MTDDEPVDGSRGEPVEYDLSDWPEDTRVDLGWMLKGRDIPYDLDADGTLVVPEARSQEVDTFLEYLSAVPDEVNDSTDNDWRTAAASATSAPIELTVDEFYDGDQARLDSDEIEFGEEWLNADGDLCEVSWIKDTGELFVIRAPRWEPLWVEVLAIIPTQAEVERVLEGWENAMLEPKGIEWVRNRVLRHDQEGAATDAEPVDTAPDSADAGDGGPEIEEPNGDLLSQLNAKFEHEQAAWAREHGT
jgi:hypothetical protein